MALFAFILTPFAYFYYEEYDDEISTKRRVFGACKYTIFLVILLIILFVVGLVLEVFIMLLFSSYCFVNSHLGKMLTLMEMQKNGSTSFLERLTVFKSIEFSS